MVQSRRRGPALRFRVFGTPVRIGAGFPITILAVPLLFLGERGREPGFLAGWLALVTISVLVHEAGHVAALRAYGFHPDVSLNVFGGLTSTDDTGHLTTFRSIIVSLAGPAAGIMLGLTIESALLPIAGPGVAWVRSASWMVNVGWSLFNLLPVMPLDGGHVMRELVEWASRKRGAAIAWVIAISLTLVIGAWVLVGSDNGHWAALVGAVMIATNLRFFAFTARQKKLQEITIAHEQLSAGNLTDGVATLLPIARSGETDMIPNAAYTTLAWALLHERRFADLEQLNSARFHPSHRALLDGATAWYRGDLIGAFELVSHALAEGRVQPPDTYFARIFGRLGEMDRLAHHIAYLPGEGRTVAASRLQTGLAAAAA